MARFQEEVYLHDLDKTALAALKAIPGFTQVLKAFMKVWNEQQFKIINMSTNLRLGEKQMAKYYHMLQPICEKLEIPVPELYVEMDVIPNAYTAGDTKPFIVMTTGLLETMPDELIPTVLAHECGHIACHHVLYHTMGRIILNGAGGFLGLGNIALYPIQLAFAYWMRCSEYSADRVAAICDGTPDKVVEMCMRFAGYDKRIQADVNTEEFLAQAVEYKELIRQSAWNKSLEFMMFQNRSHPLNAVRAYEICEWAKGDRYRMICDYMYAIEEKDEGKRPIFLSPKKFVGREVYEVSKELEKMGFLNISVLRQEQAERTRPGAVLSVSVNGEYVPENWFTADAQILVTYFEPKTIEEQQSENPGKLRIPDGARSYLGRNFETVSDELKRIGFTNISTACMPLPRIRFLEREGGIARMTIDSNPQFAAGDWYAPDVSILIYYYSGKM